MVHLLTGRVWRCERFSHWQSMPRLLVVWHQLGVERIGSAEISSGRLSVSKSSESLPTVKVPGGAIGIQFNGPIIVLDRLLILLEEKIGDTSPVIGESIGGVLRDLTIQTSDYLLEVRG